MGDAHAALRPPEGRIDGPGMGSGRYGGEDAGSAPGGSRPVKPNEDREQGEKPRRRPHPSNLSAPLGCSESGSGGRQDGPCLPVRQPEAPLRDRLQTRLGRLQSRHAEDPQRRGS